MTQAEIAMIFIFVFAAIFCVGIVGLFAYLAWVFSSDPHTPRRTSTRRRAALKSAR